MKRNRIVSIVLSALSLLNFLVGGLMGFILIKGENLKIFNFIFWICLATELFCLLCSWYELHHSKNKKETYYNAPRLKKWHIVKERRIYKFDAEQAALEIGISGWALSLIVPMFALGTIWPDTFWQFSFNVYIKSLGTAAILFGLIMGIIKYKREKGAKA